MSPISPKNIAQKSTQSALWLYSQKLILRLIGLLAIAFLARQLEPADFGLVAIANVVVSFATFISRNTVGPFITQDHDTGWEERSQAAFWLNLTIAGGILALFLVLSPYAVRFYDEPLLGTVLAVVTLTFFFAQLTVIPDSLLRRNFDYKKLVIRNTFFRFASVVTSIIMAVTGWGVWSLIIPDLLLAIPRFVVVAAMSHWRPSLKMRMDLWKPIFNYTKHVIGTSALGNILNDGDPLVVGKTLGNEMVGFYDRAWNTANLVTSNVSGVVSDISLPALAAYYKSAPELLVRAYQKMLMLLSLLTLPMFVIMYILADAIIISLYGEKWIPSILILRILILLAIQRSLFSSTGTIFFVTGRPDIGLKLNVIQVPIYLIGIIVGSLFGIIGVALSVTVIRTLFGLLSFYFACRLINLSFSKGLRDLLPSLEISVLMGVFVWVIKMMIETLVVLPPVLSLLLYSMVAGMIFLLLLLFRYNALLNELFTVLERLSLPLASSVRLWLRYPQKTS